MAVWIIHSCSNHWLELTMNCIDRAALEASSSKENQRKLAILHSADHKTFGNFRREMGRALLSLKGNYPQWNNAGHNGKSPGNQSFLTRKFDCMEILDTRVKLSVIAVHLLALHTSDYQCLMLFIWLTVFESNKKF